MIHYQTELTIVFGDVGTRHEQEAFCIRLDGSGISELIKDAENAYRLYELMLIERPGDVWAYVWVILDALPLTVARRVEYARQEAQPPYSDKHPWPSDRIPFTVFDELFYWSDDSDPEDEAWLNHRYSQTLNAFADQLFTMVCVSHADLSWNDVLLSHIITTIKTGKHPFSYLDRPKAIKEFQGHLNQPLYTAAFYKKLDELLRDPELVSVAYRDGRDYQVLRKMATEQRRRANLTGHAPGYALHLSSLANNRVNNAAWNSEIWLFDEGLAHGDLHIEGDRGHHKDLHKLISDGRRIPGRHILSTQDEGNFKGYIKESGDGWVLYKQEQPDSRRRCLERIASRRIHSKPLLQFGNQGQTIYDFEKIMVFVGDGVDSPKRTFLAEIIADWQRKGVDLVLVILGDTSPFELARCRNIHQPTQYLELNQSNMEADWFKTILRKNCAWLDVLITLDTPDWAANVLNNWIRNKYDPWSTWVVSNVDKEPLKTDLLLEGDLLETLPECCSGRANAR